MMERLVRKSMGSVVACLLVLSVSVMAEMHQKQDMPKEDTSSSRIKAHAHKEGMAKAACNIAGRAGMLQSSEAVLGMAVQNLQGSKLGYVEELILDDTRQAIEYAVIAANGKLYPVPWTAFDAGMETYTLNIDADRLRQAPTVSSLDSKQFKDSALREKSHGYYQKQITAVQDKNIAERAVDWARKTTAEVFGEAPAPMVYSANQVLGFEVRNAQGNDIGELEDIVFDVRQGNLAYGLIRFGGVLGIGAKTAAVPWETIRLESTQDIARLEADESNLQAAVLEDDDIRHLSEPMFARQVHQNFGREPYWEVFGFVPPSGTDDVSTMAWQPDSAYNMFFDKNTVETLDGTVTKVGSFMPEKGAAPGLKLKVETADGKTLTVYAGPKQHYLQQQVKFQKGDQVSVMGSKTTVEQKSVIMASEIHKGDQTLRLRDAQGKPLWKSDMQSGEMKDKRQKMSEPHGTSPY